MKPSEIYTSIDGVAIASPLAKDSLVQPVVLENTLVRNTQETNLGQSVSMDSLASDDNSFTGPANGFASRFVAGKLGEE